MLAGPLPETVDYRRLAMMEREIEGRVAVSRMSRLVDMLATPEGEFSVKLRFGTRKGKRMLVMGRVEGEVQVTCQRCLAPMPLTLDVAVRSYLVPDDDALAELDPEDDGLVVEPGDIRTVALIEDDLMVSLPMAPLHESPCGEDWSAPEPVAAEPETHRPFAGLADLMNKTD